MTKRDKLNMARILKASHLAGVAGAAMTLATFQPAMAQTGSETQTVATTSD